VTTENQEKFADKNKNSGQLACLKKNLWQIRNSVGVGIVKKKKPKGSQKGGSGGTHQEHEVSKTGRIDGERYWADAKDRSSITWKMSSNRRPTLGGSSQFQPKKKRIKKKKGEKKKKLPRKKTKKPDQVHLKKDPGRDNRDPVLPRPSC